MLTPYPAQFDIPEGTICLTFDDGPGPQTLDIARLFAGYNIRATFFVVGRRVEHDLATVQEVRRLGHWIGNHTYHHPPLAALAWAGKDVVAEVTDTDRLIAELVGDGPFLLRPPYGNWSSRVAELLNGSTATRKYIGPVMWDIDGADHAVGKPLDGGVWTVEKCAAKYLREIETRHSGVVLLHDGGKAAAEISDSGGTLELLNRLVPRLKSQFDFKSLNEIPLADNARDANKLGIIDDDSAAAAA